MMSERVESSSVELVGHDGRVSHTEVCHRCRIDAGLLEALVEHGVVEPHRPAGFTEIHLVRITRAVRVMHEFDVRVDHLALVVDLLDTLGAQRRELALLRRLVAEGGGTDEA